MRRCYEALKTLAFVVLLYAVFGGWSHVSFVATELYSYIEDAFDRMTLSFQVNE